MSGRAEITSADGRNLPFVDPFTCQVPAPRVIFFEGMGQDTGLQAPQATDLASRS